MLRSVVAFLYLRAAHTAYPTLNQVGKYGHLSVELFFLISACIILHSTRGKAFGQLFRSRVRYLGPMMAGWLVYATLAGQAKNARPFGLIFFPRHALGFIAEGHFYLLQTEPLARWWRLPKVLNSQHENRQRCQ